VIRAPIFDLDGAVAIFRDPAGLLERYYQSPVAG
jgi:hypothetical protein